MLNAILAQSSGSGSALGSVKPEPSNVLFFSTWWELINFVGHFYWNITPHHQFLCWPTKVFRGKISFELTSEGLFCTLLPHEHNNEAFWSISIGKRFEHCHYFKQIRQDPQCSNLFFIWRHQNAYLEVVALDLRYQVLSSPVTSPTCGLASLLNENAQAMLSNTTIPSSDPEFSL